MRLTYDSTTLLVWHCPKCGYEDRPAVTYRDAVDPPYDAVPLMGWASMGGERPEVPPEPTRRVVDEHLEIGCQRCHHLAEMQVEEAHDDIRIDSAVADALGS